MQVFHFKFLRHDLSNIPDKPDAEIYFFPGHGSGRFQGFQGNKDIAVALSPGFNYLIKVFTRPDERIPSPETSGSIISPCKLEIQQGSRSPELRCLDWHAQWDGRFHNHFILLNRVNIMGRNAILLKKFKKVGCKSACYGSFPRNTSDNSIVTGIKNHLAVFNITRSFISKNKPVFTGKGSIRYIIYIFRFSAVNEIFFFHGFYFFQLVW